MISKSARGYVIHATLTGNPGYKRPNRLTSRTTPVMNGHTYMCSPRLNVGGWTLDVYLGNKKLICKAVLPTARQPSLKVEKKGTA
jgi:hypothetical protein